MLTSRCPLLPILRKLVRSIAFIMRWMILIAPNLTTQEYRQRSGADQRLSGLLMIQGPLLITRPRPWAKPRVENGNLAGSQPPTAHRLFDWLRAGVTVKGQDKWSFVKLHTHGAQENNAAVLLGPAMSQLHRALRELSAHQGFQFYYVTAREMAQLVMQAENNLPAPDFDRLGWN